MSSADNQVNAPASKSGRHFVAVKSHTPAAPLTAKVNLREEICDQTVRRLDEQADYHE